MKLEQILKDLLHERDMTVAQLSRTTGVALQTLDNWLSGQEPRSLRQVKKVASYFEVPVDYLCFGETSEKKTIEDYKEEINAGIFEVILRRAKPRGPK